MELWTDQAIILSVKHHGENGAIVWALTAERGLQAGYVRGARGSKMRGTIELGNLVDARWQARNDSDLGTFTFELLENPSVNIMQDSLRLAALQSACALCRYALPEREASEGVYQGLLSLFHALDSDVWAEAYVFWEIALLKELGFSLDLQSCAGGGDAGQLAYVSPKTGRAVSLEQGEPYKDKLLVLPAFLGGQGDLVAGFDLTLYFLTHWVFAHHNKGVPDDRLVFQSRVAKMQSL